MKKLVTVVVLIAAIVGGLALMLTHRKSAQGEWAYSKPDTVIRGAVANVTPGQIAAVRLEVLPDMMVITPRGEAPKVEVLGLQPGFQYRYSQNPEAIALLLRGLKSATIPSEYRLNRTNHIALILNDGTVVGPFGFARCVQVDCFSPSFIEGLKKARIRSIPR